jgi:hypothetical protein
MRKNSGSEEMIWELQMIYEDVSMDAQYMDAVKRGDVETAQRMVDDAAREAGEPESKFIITKGRDIDGDEQLEIDLGDYLMTMLFPDSNNNQHFLCLILLLEKMNEWLLHIFQEKKKRFLCCNAHQQNFHLKKLHNRMHILLVRNLYKLKVNFHN